MSEWTTERIDVLQRMAREGHSASSIAIELGDVTRNAVIGKLHRLGMRTSARKQAPPNEAQRAFVGARKRKPRQVARVVVEVTIDEPAERIGLADLQHHHCRWPVEDDLDGPMFCGAPKAAGNTPYCERHDAISRPHSARL